jgi:hypothetical protein
VELEQTSSNKKTLGSRDRYDVSKLGIRHSRAYQVLLTFLEHSTPERAFPMHASILSFSISSTNYKDAGTIDPIEQSPRLTTPISLNKSIGYVKAFLTLPNSNTLAFFCLSRQSGAVKNFLG